MNQDIRPDHRGACSFEGCPSFDGKRCRVLGCRPGAEAGCIPRIGEVQEELARETQALKAEEARSTRLADLAGGFERAWKKAVREAAGLRHVLKIAADELEFIRDHASSPDFRRIAGNALAAIRKEEP